MPKSTVEEIRARFDADVERFSRLDVGNSAQVDSLLSLELIAEAAALVTPQAKRLLDVGCGAGNYSLKILERLPGLDVALLDLSGNMLARARQRVGAATTGAIETLPGDIREVELGESRFDLIVASAVLHHLRDEPEWRSVFAKLHWALTPGGSLWIYDLVAHALPELEAAMHDRYGEFLLAQRDAAYRDHVFAYVAAEDTPRPLDFQLRLLHEAGFRQVEVLHKHLCFAAFGARK